MKQRGSSSAWGYMTGAAGVVASLRRAGVGRVFGIPSIIGSPLFDAFADSPVEIVLVTDEQSAAFMASAHARLTGELSACVLSPGQGLARAVCGIAQARMDSTPMLVLVASGTSVPPSGRDRPEPLFDQLAMARPVCKRVFLLDEPEMVPSGMSRAVQLARSGEPGPVLVEIPADVQRGSARMEGTGFRPGPRVLQPEAAEELDRACQFIESSLQVGLYAGSGCFEALAELSELAERLDAPVATTLSGLGALPLIHPLSVGFGPGPAGSPMAQAAFASCDLVIAVGCRFSEAAAGGLSVDLNAALVHIDIEPGVAGGNMTADAAVTAPAKQALRYFLDRIADQEHPEMRRLIRDAKRQQRRCLNERPEWDDAVDPVKFFVQLHELLASEDVVVLDSGHHAFFGVACFPVQAARTLLMPVDCRAAGFAVPAAVAAKLARPHGRVVGCVGEGGFLRTGQELLTARRCNVAPVVVVFADRQPGLSSALNQRVLRREAAVDLAPVDYQQMAESMGVRYVCIHRDRELVDGLKWALTIEAPVVVELRVAWRDAATYLRIANKLELRRLPRAASLRLGARLVLLGILGRGITSSASG